MASQDVEVSLPTATHETAPLPKLTAMDDVVEAVTNVSLQDEATTYVNQKVNEPPPRPLHVYTRYGLLHLSKSPLVNIPEGMPALKDWFGCVTLAKGPAPGNNDGVQRLERTSGK